MVSEALAQIHYLKLNLENGLSKFCAHISGKLRIDYIKILPGNKVKSDRTITIWFNQRKNYMESLLNKATNKYEKVGRKLGV